MTKLRWLVVLAGASAVALSQSVGVAADQNPQPVDISNVMNAPAPDTSAQFGTAPKARPGQAYCVTQTSTAANVNTDCTESTVGPHNETSIAVNPTNTSNMIGGVNDYQLTLNPDGHVSETVLSRAHVTVDGGKTWAMYPVFTNASYMATGDPSLAFDATGHAYYGTLGFRFVSKANAQNPDVLVSNSADGGKTWNVVRVAAGSGVESGTGDLLDKEYVRAWGSGNAIVSFGDFRLSKGFTVGSSIFTSVTHDFGAHWSIPVVVSGSDAEAFVSTPAIAADGRIFVSYLNTRNLSNGRDDVRVVEVDPTTGARIAGPFTVTQEIPDGFTDYPIDADGRQTYQDSQLRTWAAGDLATDPTNAAHLAMIWSDMRNNPVAVEPTDPYTAKTNSDVIVSQSFDSGVTWSSPTAIALAGDQFMPWGEYDGTGSLRIGFFDRSGDPANHLYNYTLATESTPGSLSFSFTTVSTVASDPTTNDRWFARNVNANFLHATAFMGDYGNIAIVPGGGVVEYWTDLRTPATFAGVTRQGEDAYFAAIG